MHANEPEKAIAYSISFTAQLKYVDQRNVKSRNLYNISL